MPTEKYVKRLKNLVLLAAIVLETTCAGVLAQGTSSRGDPGQAAAALEQQGKNAEAETAWRAVVKAHPSDAEAYAHLGFLEARQEHYRQAVPLYRKAFALNPAMPGLRLNLALSLFKSGALKEAIDNFSVLIKSTPAGSPEAQRLTSLIGIAHYGLGEFKAAVPYLKQAAAGDPRNLAFRLFLAHSCLASEQYQCVLDVYHEILLLNAESAEADMLAGEAMDELHDHDGAIQQFRNAIKANPKEPTVHFGLGYLLWTQNQFEEAAREFQAELANVPDHAEALAFLADSNMQMNHPEGALPLLEKAVSIDPNVERAHLDLGILYADAGRRDEALRELKLAARLVPNDVNVHWRLARLYQAIGQKNEAKVEFDKTNSLHKAEEETVLKKLHEAQAKGKPNEGATDLPPDHSTTQE